MQISSKSSIISNVLSPAVKIWLRSQVEQIEELDIRITGQDRQIIKGYIPSVSLSSHQAIYQGLHLRKLNLQGDNIRINIGQIIKGKPLQLLEPIQVTGDIRLSEKDINNSMSSPLLSSAFKDLLVFLLKFQGISDARAILSTYQLEWQKVTIGDNLFTLDGFSIDQKGNKSPLKISAGIKLEPPNTLWIFPKTIQLMPEFSALTFQAFKIELGTDVALEKMSMTEGILTCYGQLLVRN
ncbi:DUF2993 domain-containing protein [Aphanothece hegewaldii CCALA 016]|uniref:DUF2993 domain-containing protein n=1 Tax=Aphanothece hegewaldii CCALA 016 TaxID=2107694 RepID=A0A2T1M2U7_9CHRO|nr:DUF2993 domain-containing protein [Aphanothece hegewaldii]PSF39078.1 DUF2993 domain-containing protein [Aphanothece hegewaldii CCALA 016]